MNLLFDIETNGLVPAPNLPPEKWGSRVHCIAAVDLDSDEEYFFGPDDVPAGVALLQRAAVLVGHNIAGFDVPFLRHFGYAPKDWAPVMVDTMAWARASYPEVKDKDYILWKRDPERFPGNMIGRHTLEAWGLRLGEEKGSFAKQTDWKVYSEEMGEYCQQDVRVNVKLFRHLLDRGFVPVEVAAVESLFHGMTSRLNRHGIRFDTKAAIDLYAALTKRKTKLHAELEGAFDPWFVKDGDVVTPQRAVRSRKVQPGEENFRNTGVGPECQYQKIRLVHFNPGSRDHIADRLQKVYGWVPHDGDYTAGGRPKINETILEGLPFPVIPKLVEYLLVSKRLGQLAEGDKSWLKLQKHGRIHMQVDNVGAVTSRCAHRNPNGAQVPAVNSPYGPECRALFQPDEGHVLVGADASGLELRMLANFLFPYDGGAFGRECHEGDPHTFMMKRTGITDRDVQKRWTYAKLYGAGVGKLALIMGKGIPAAQKAAINLLVGMVGLKKIEDKLNLSHSRGFLRLLDGRRASLRGRHMALNTLLQGGGAVVVKHWTVLVDLGLQAHGLTPREDYEFVLHVHDEMQLTVDPKWVESGLVEEVIRGALQLAAQALNVNVPLACDVKVGANWKETH